MIVETTKQPTTARHSPRQRRAAMLWAGFAGVLLAMQAVPAPERNNPPVVHGLTLEANVLVPPYVSRIINEACGNCHSNETRWPWYSRVAPLSWMIGNHVHEGRKTLNFSEWAKNGADFRVASIVKLSAACAAVEQGIMPPRSYLVLHPEARLSASEKGALCAWANTEVRTLTGK